MPGADFAKVIADQVASCDALIAVIGKDWLTARDGDGHRRLDHPSDFVKAEIREALAHDKLVIPALVEGASIPKAADLPPDIAKLAARNAIEISDSRFAYDTERLIRAVQAHTDGAPNPRSRPAKHRRSWAWVSDPNHQRTLGFIGAGITAAAIAGWTVYVHFSDQVTPVAAPGVWAYSGGIDVTAKAGPRGTVIIATGPVATGITLEEHEASLKRREQELREVLARARRDDSEEIARLKKELAAAEAKRKNQEQALSDFSAKLAEASQALQKLGPEHPDVAASLNNLAALYGAQGQYAKAEPLYQRALGIREKALGPEHPDVAASLNNLAALYYAQGQYAKAEPLFQHALRIWEATLSSDDPDLAQAMEKYAALLGRLNRDDEAKAWQAKADAARERHAGTSPGAE